MKNINHSNRSSFRIQITSPCQEDWNGMFPCSGGRHCTVCDKTVVDFTKMKTQEIQDFFQNAKGQKVCGRFHSSQVGGKQHSVSSFFINLVHQVEENIHFKPGRMVLLSVLAACMTLIGCDFKMGASAQPIGDTLYVEQVDSSTTISDSIQTKGDTSSISK